VQELLLQCAGFTLPIVEGIDGRLVVMPEHVFEGVMGNGGGKREDNTTCTADQVLAVTLL